MCVCAPNNNQYPILPTGLNEVNEQSTIRKDTKMKAIVCEKYGPPECARATAYWEK